ncbi:hypothetical protein FNYG_04580 [Fusarium nygamai]|uniref:Uncharacterized protein n=1 Tax=Gibberella nygamai TaxID=42673 RepID=A0A2K0WIC0_GIBNY|nr:hypothetical protein FNYG_04580 [Fusarium nygamai]
MSDGAPPPTPHTTVPDSTESNSTKSNSTTLIKLGQRSEVLVNTHALTHDDIV